MRTELLTALISEGIGILNDVFFLTLTSIHLHRNWVFPGEIVKSTVSFPQGNQEILAGDPIKISYVFSENGIIYGFLGEKNGVNFYFEPWEVEKME